MCKAVAQLVLLYGNKSWLVTREMLKVLTALHNQAAQRITRMTEKHESGREWEYPEVEESTESTGIHPIRVYIKRRKTTIAERVAFLPVYELCTEVEIIPGRSGWCYGEINTQ